MKRIVVALLAACALLSSAVASFAQDPTELLRADIRANKTAIVTSAMELDDTQSEAFWPIYREYDAEMAKLGDERLALIVEYAGAYDNMTDAAADKLATKALDLENRRHAAKAKCYERVKAALSPRTAMKFLQVEHQLTLIMDLQVAASLPVAK